jgi:DNA modification methylase
MDGKQATLFETQAAQPWSQVADHDLKPDEEWVVVRDNKAYHTVHRFHPYFAMCPPPIARMAIERFTQPGETVGDPFCGAGVTLVEAMLTGRHSVGVDILSIATLVSKVKTTPVQYSLAEARALADRIRLTLPTISNPKSVLPPVVNIDYWFPEETQRQFAAILSCIADEPNPDRLDFLKVAFSSIVRMASRAGNMEAHLHIKPRKPLPNAVARFQARLLDMATRERHFLEQLPSPRPHVEIYTRDNRDMADILPDHSLHFIFTSPPYGTGSKYASIYRLQLEFLQLKRPKKPLETSKDFAADLTGSFREMYRVLKPGRVLAILYGTNSHFSSADVAKMAEQAGFTFDSNILCPVIDESKMVRGDYRRHMANEHLIAMRKPG